MGMVGMMLVGMKMIMIPFVNGKIGKDSDINDDHSSRDPGD